MTRTTRCAVAVALLLLLPAIASGQRNALRKRGLSAETGYQVGEIDHINLLNGNLVVSIPLGITYPVGPSLSYQLHLFYNSYSWDHDDVLCQEGPYANPIQEETNNAGFGWTLHLGRLAKPDTNINGQRWRYVAPDGSQHAFYGTLRSGTSVPDVYYSRSNSYVRFRRVTDVNNDPCTSAKPAGTTDECALIEMPNGNVSEFRNFGNDEPEGSDYRLIRMRDTFGNYLNVTYDETGTEFDVWTLEDSHGRSHTVEFIKTTPKYKRVKNVKLASFADPGNSNPAVYTLVYSNITLRKQGYVSAYCSHLDDGTPMSGTLATLALWRLLLPDSAFYEFSYHTGLGEDGVSGTADDEILAGGMASLRLPTGGKYAWTYKPHGFSHDNPDPDPRPGPRGPDDPPAPPDGDKVYAVADKKVYLSSTAGSPIGTWTYNYVKSTEVFPSDTAVRCHQETVIKDPLGNESVHYFSTAIQNNHWLYGLPYSLCRYHSATDSYLSAEVFEGSRSSGDLRRSVRVAYDSDAFQDYAELNTEHNNRLRYQRTIYHDDLVNDVPRYKETVFSNFDGYGHYRSQTDNDNFSGTHKLRRSTYTDYKAASTYAGGHDWLFGIHSLKNVVADGTTVRAELCFDPSNGFLSRSRRRAGAGRQNTDTFTLYELEDADVNGLGQARSEIVYGGDGSAAVLDNGSYAELCDADLPNTALGGPIYQTDKTYAYGALATATAVDPCDGAAILSLADVDIDRNTGLVSTRRDASGLATAYAYDARGRLDSESPPGVSPLNYEYDLPDQASPSLVPKLTVMSCQNTSSTACGASGALTFHQLQYDGLGRLVKERLKIDSSVTSERGVTYNAMGWKTSESQWGSTLTTSYTGYDRFGRVGTITPPGANPATSFTYVGERVKTRETQVMQGTLNSPSLAPVYTTEVVDSRGLLVTVCENGASEWDGTCTGLRTDYTYDVGDRLRHVCANASGTSCGQTRAFSYDHRGFLTSETHPELNNQATTYTHDARGNVLKKNAPGSYPDFDLVYEYDAAGRLTQVEESNSTAVRRQLKRYFYGYANDGSDYRTGKLVQTIRYNWVDAVGPLGNSLANPGEIEAQVAESFRYEGRGGRPSTRLTRYTTVDSTTPQTTHAFELSLTYDKLGNVKTLTYPQCIMGTENCSAAAPTRQVTFGYSQGLLVSAADDTQTFASSLTYQGAGMLDEITHANGVVETIEINPLDEIQRPHRITTSAGFDTGAYAYDGAGNITEIGALKFVYDGLSRLVTGQADAGGTIKTQSVTYDDYGNIQSLTTGGTALTTATSTTTNRLTGLSASYDAAGNMTNVTLGGKAFVYSYDAANMMKHLRSSDQARTFLYTVDDERVAQLDCANDGCTDIDPTETWTLRDLDGHVLRTYKWTSGEGWEWVEDYVYNGRNVLATIKNDGNGGENVLHAHVDHLGTPRQFTDSSGTAVEAHNYYPFGEEATVASSSERMRFTGHERDAGAPGSKDDLDYMHARYCSPAVARFVSIDPARASASGSPQLWNRYSYVRNNPLILLDPDGEEVALASGLSDAHRKRITVAVAKAMRNSDFADRMQSLERSALLFTVGAGTLGSKAESNSVTFEAGLTGPRIYEGKVVGGTTTLDLDAISNPSFNERGTSDVEVLSHELGVHGTSLLNPGALQMTADELDAERDAAHKYGAAVANDPAMHREPSEEELRAAEDLLSRDPFRPLGGSIK